MKKYFLDLVDHERLPLDLAWDAGEATYGRDCEPRTPAGCRGQVEFHRRRVRETATPRHASWHLGRLYRQLLERP